MTRANNIPVYATEQIINQETEQIQEILDKFKQPIPNGFIPIEVEHICSTKSNWEGKPLSERYSLIHEGEWKQIDIPHTFMEELGLEKGQDITQFLYLNPKVLKNREETYKGITIQEGEIFLQQPFNINNLEQNLNKFFERIEKLEREKEENQEAIIDLKKELAEAENLKNIWRNKYLKEKEGNSQEIEDLKKWSGEIKKLKALEKRVKNHFGNNYEELLEVEEYLEQQETRE